MKNRFTITASCAVILTLGLAVPAMAQSSDRSAEHDAFIQDIMEEDGAYLEDIEGYGNQGQVLQSPYGQYPYAQNPYGQNQQPYHDNGSDPCSIYANYKTPACQNRQSSQNPYRQNPYGQNSYAQSPYGQPANPYAQPQSPNTGYAIQNPAMNLQSVQNPFGPPPATPHSAQTVQVMDTQNPQGRPMVASTRKIPAGWRASGGVNWRQNNNVYCGLMTPHTSWSATSPDGQSKMEVWPEERFAGSQSPIMRGVLGNCPNVDIHDTRGFVTQFVLNRRRGAQITNIKQPTPSEKTMLQQVLPPLPPSGDPSMRQSQEINGAVVNLTYQENGHSYDEVVFMSWITVHSTQAPIMGFGGSTVHNTVTPQAFAMRAPSGQLDETIAEAFYASDNPNPAHQAMTRQYHEQKSKELSRRLIAESKARMRVNRMSPGSIGNSNPVGDIIARGGPESGRNLNGPSNTINAIRSVNEYNDPNSITGTVEGTTGQGRYMYRNDDGSYVQTNDPLYNQGTQLEPRE